MPFNIDDLGDEFLSEAASRISKRLKKIDRTLHLIANGRGYLAESKSRRKVFKHRQKMLLAEEINTAVFSDRETPGGRDELGLERNIGKTNDILSIEFLEAGLLAARSVGRITVLFGDSSGTAFHVGHQVVITNHHVLSDPGLTETAGRSSHFTIKRCPKRIKMVALSTEMDASCRKSGLRKIPRTSPGWPMKGSGPPGWHRPSGTLLSQTRPRKKSGTI
jgi:hypothetical protein